MIAAWVGLVLGLVCLAAGVWLEGRQRDENAEQRATRDPGSG